ncbi:MAG: hypothetical protein ACI3Z7_03990 [Candidatus Aphodosoma sp.]
MNRKIIIVLSLLASVLLSSCYPSYSLIEFPKARFCAYLPYTDGQVVSFTNQNHDTISFTAKVYPFNQERWLSPKYGESQGYEITTYGVTLQKEEYNIILNVRGEFYRDSFVSTATLHPHDSDSRDVRFIYSAICIKAADFPTLLADTLSLHTGINEDLTATIINGRGLVEYPYDGTVWHVVE